MQLTKYQQEIYFNSMKQAKHFQLQSPTNQKQQISKTFECC